MNLQTKLNVLKEIYKIYDNYAGTLNLKKKKKCAHCCTRNVAMTSVEGQRLLLNIPADKKENLLEKVRSELENKRYVPKVTTNQFADICMRGEEPPEEDIDQSLKACPLLEDGECSVYDERPFECRSFISTKNCSENGYADIDNFSMTVNTVFKQYIEHIDENGFSGNLSDVFLFLDSRMSNSAPDQNITLEDHQLIKNQKMNVLMVEPEHQAKIQDIIDEIRAIRVPKDSSHC